MRNQTIYYCAKCEVLSPCRKTVEFCRQVESAGASFISVHGRTKQQRCEPVNTEAVRIINDSVRVPVIHNGDITSLQSMNDIVEKTGEIGRAHV